MSPIKIEKALKHWSQGADIGNKRKKKRGYAIIPEDWGVAGTEELDLQLNVQESPLLTN